VYEKEPDNVTRLMDLMQEVQEYGQPPTEIIQEIAPGIELDAEGMPKLDGSNLPFPPNEECCIT
jgi:peroxin-19